MSQPNLYFVALTLKRFCGEKNSKKVVRVVVKNYFFVNKVFLLQCFFSEEEKNCEKSRKVTNNCNQKKNKTFFFAKQVFW